MTNSEELANKIREAFSRIRNVEEKKMFGGVAFMVNGKMCVTVRDSRIMCRVDPMKHAELIRRKGCRTMTMRGREYKGYVLVEERALKTRNALHYWVQLALDFNERAKASKKKIKTK